MWRTSEAKYLLAPPSERKGGEGEVFVDGDNYPDATGTGSLLLLMWSLMPSSRDSYGFYWHRQLVVTRSGGRGLDCKVKIHTGSTCTGNLSLLKRTAVLVRPVATLQVRPTHHPTHRLLSSTLNTSLTTPLTTPLTIPARLIHEPPPPKKTYIPATQPVRPSHPAHLAVECYSDDGRSLVRFEHGRLDQHAHLCLGSGSG